MKWFLTIIAVITFVAGMAFGYLGHSWLLTIGFLACIAFLVTANLDRLAEFKASSSGFEARTREVVVRAESAITELQLLAKQVAELSLSLVKRQGRWGGYNDDELESIRESVLSVLTKLDISEQVQRQVLREWHRITELDYSHAILGGNIIPDGTAPAVMEEWKFLREGGFNNIPTPETLRSFLSTHGFLTPEIEQYLLDYEYYRSNQKHRRPAVWRDRDDESDCR